MFVGSRSTRKRKKPIETEDDAALHIQRIWKGRQARKSLATKKMIAGVQLQNRDQSGLAAAAFTMCEPETIISSGPWKQVAWESPKEKEEPEDADIPEKDVTPEEMMHEFRVQLYNILEEPTSSKTAQVVSIMILSVIVFSIACFIFESMPKLRKIPNISQIWKTLELFCTVIFTIEYFVRMSVCTVGGVTVWQFIKTPSNIFDVLAIMPFYLQAVMASTGGGGNSTAGLRVLRAVRLIRLFRIFKLGRYSSGMQLMAQAVTNSLQALYVLLFFLMIGVILFSCALFYTERLSCPASKELTAEQLALYELECRASNDGWDKTLGHLCCDEHDSPLDFPSIPEAFWWAIVTMTTCGFGDISPKTTQGKIIGTVTMLSGILLIALPVAIVGRKFQEAYDDFMETNSNQKEKSINGVIRKYYSAASWEELEPSATPMTGLGSRLRQLQGEDESLSEAIGELSDLLDEADKMNVRIHCMKVAEVHRQQELHRRFHKVLEAFAETSGLYKSESVSSAFLNASQGS